MHFRGSCTIYGTGRCLTSHLFNSVYAYFFVFLLLELTSWAFGWCQRSICLHASQFGGSEQHDSQEFLSFLLDGLHEDLNRILKKPINEVTTTREEELEKLPQQIASEQEWKIYRMRNDSIVVDFFQGQFRNRLECLTCHKVSPFEYLHSLHGGLLFWQTSTTYNSFMYLSLPIPSTKTSKVDIQQCLDAFVRTEVMEKSDAW
jgi:ubiquitin carboxyl-terminal hydrolase 8